MNPVRLHYLFRKHFAQLNKASVKHVDLCYILTPIVLPDFQCAAIQCEHLDRFAVRVCNPVFLNLSPLVQIQLYESIMPPAVGLTITIFSNEGDCAIIYTEGRS